MKMSVQFLFSVLGFLRAARLGCDAKVLAGTGISNRSDECELLGVALTSICRAASGKIIEYKTLETGRTEKRNCTRSVSCSPTVEL